MSRVAVVTDTTAYLPSELVRERGISIVSLYVNWDDHSERESDMTNFDDFYARLRSAQKLPTTSQPSIGDFLEVYEPLIEAGREIVSIHISGGISGTVESARQAAARADERNEQAGITVIDSMSSAGGLGMVVLAAAHAAASGAGREAVVEAANEARNGLAMWFAVDTLEYLRRGGRIGAASAWLGSALKIEPILTLEEQITPIEGVRTGARALQRLIDYGEQRHSDGADAWVVQHIQAPEQAAKLVEATRSLMGTEPLFVSEVGPVLGTHVGPGLLGIGGMQSKLLD